eukprot:8151662-Lingulodinium_polyedra.AAC.1
MPRARRRVLILATPPVAAGAPRVLRMPTCSSSARRRPSVLIRRNRGAPSPAPSPRVLPARSAHR